MKPIYTLIAALSFSILLPAMASGQTSSGSFQPIGDDRCLSRGPIGFSLAGCSTANQISFENLGQIQMNSECVFVQAGGGQGTDFFTSGTTLMARSCSDSTIPSVNGEWMLDSGNHQIRLANPPDPAVEKCLSIAGPIGVLRAVIKDCDEFGVTQWQFHPG